MYLRDSLWTNPVLSFSLFAGPGEALVLPAAAGGLPVYHTLLFVVETGGKALYFLWVIGVTWREPVLTL